MAAEAMDFMRGKWSSFWWLSFRRPTLMGLGIKAYKIQAWENFLLGRGCF